jgi:transposase
LAQRSALEEVIFEAGHKCIFYPKFHCELNYIERYWGAAKRYARENCNYSWSGLQCTVPAALESVNIIMIRKFARKAWRYMDLYRKGITGKLAEYAAKKYKSHRCIPDYVLVELNK